MQNYNPEIHDKIDGGYVLKGAGKPSIRVISIGAFRRRLTIEEKVAIKTSDDPVVQVLDDDLKASSFADLDFQPLIDGLNYLVVAKVLTAERVSILLADGEDHEQVNH